MGESSVVVHVPQGRELELRELERSPIIVTPPNGTPSQSRLQAATTTPVMDKTMSSATNLVKLLPTGTVFAFQTLSPSFSHQGTCYTSNKCLMGLLICLCLLSCIFFSFTDSLIGRDGKLYYGIATFKGFYIFNYDGREEDKNKVFKDLGRFQIRWLDYLHAWLCLLVFLTLCFSDSNTQTCFFPTTNPNTKELLVNLPLGTGFLASIIFLLFPTSRKGIGYSDMMPQSP